MVSRRSKESSQINRNKELYVDIINWNDIKKIPREELLEMVPEWFKFKTNPWTHQIAAFLANISNPGFLDALDLGTGKTKVSIDTVRYYARNNKKIRVLFICLNTAVEKMRDEVKTHSELSAICVRGTTKEKWKIFNRKKNFYIINYEGLRAMLTERVVIGKTKDGKQKRTDILNADAIKKLISKKFDVLILDESHKIKNHKSLTFGIISVLRKAIDKRILLTGTPFGNTLLDIWSQYLIIDDGDTFGRNYTFFRNKYFENRAFVMRIRGIERMIPNWKPTDEGIKFITDHLYTKAIRYEESEVEDLPPKVFRVLEYDLSKKQKEEYQKLYSNLEESELTKDITNKAMGFRQISSGFIKSSDYVFKENPKLELLMDIIETVMDEHKVVVFTDFTKSRKIIEKELNKKKIKFCSISGETKDKYSQQVTFQNDPSYRVMVAQIRSGGTSIDLFAATYCVHFEICRSVIEYKQSIKRIHRGGQTQRCYFYNLIGNNTIEVNIHKDIENGVDAFSRIADGKDFRRYISGEDA